MFLSIDYKGCWNEVKGRGGGGGGGGGGGVGRRRGFAGFASMLTTRVYGQSTVKITRK